MTTSKLSGVKKSIRTDRKSAIRERTLHFGEDHFWIRPQLWNWGLSHKSTSNGFWCGLQRHWVDNRRICSAHFRESPQKSAAPIATPELMTPSHPHARENGLIFLNLGCANKFLAAPPTHTLNSSSPTQYKWKAGTRTKAQTLSICARKKQCYQWMMER